MKKTLLSILASLVVVGSASAIPSIDDRKAMCEKYPERYVWVEKTQVCIPVNPCTATSFEVQQIYCVEKFAGIMTKSDADIRDIIQRYLRESQGGIEAVSIKEIDYSYEKEHKFFAVETSDKGYLGFIFYAGTDHDFTNDMMRAACWAYDGFHEPSGFITRYECGGVSKTGKCEDIADFAAYLSGTNVSSEYDAANQLCSLDVY